VALRGANSSGGVLDIKRKKRGNYRRGGGVTGKGKWAVQVDKKPGKPDQESPGAGRSSLCGPTEESRGKMVRRGKMKRE